MEQEVSKAELQANVNEAVAEAGNIPVKTQKQIDKEKKAEANYWKSMITREEARTLVIEAMGQMDEKFRMLYVTTSTLMNFVLQKGLATKEELDAISRPLVQAMYGLPDAPEPKEEEPTHAMDEVASSGATKVGD